MNILCLETTGITVRTAGPEISESLMKTILREKHGFILDLMKI